jgi:hypothetical protein
MVVESNSEAIELPEEVRAINVGLAAFGEAIREQGAEAVDVDWRIPAGGDPELIRALTRLHGSRAEAVAEANREVLRRLDESSPVLVEVAARSTHRLEVTTMRRLTVVLAAAFLALPALAEAQQGTAQRTLVEGRRSIVFEWPLFVGTAGGHGRLEAWQMRSPNTNIGLVLQAHVESRTFDPPAPAERIRSQSFAVGPALKRYMEIHSTIAPYLRGHAMIGFAREETELPASTVESSSWGFLVGGGIGAEWFPWERIGLGGFTGRDLTFDRERIQDDRRTTVGLSTLTTGLQVLFYF